MSAKEDITREITAKMANILTLEQLQILESKVATVLYKYNIAPSEQSLTTEVDKDSMAIRNFFIAKKVEGLSDKSLRYYKETINKFTSIITMPFANIEPNTVRYYLAVRMETLSNVSLDNERRVLRSFFNWLSDEDYIGKSPFNSIRPIKKEKRVKKPFTEMELEKIRQAASEGIKNELRRARDIAIIEFLYSTGARASEIVGVNRSDIKGDECIVFGKGAKERTVFLNAKCLFALEEYLKLRTDDNPALFISCQKPYNRLSAEGLRGQVGEIGQMAGVENVHPHRFRRTMATVALNRGMPIEEVSQILGHEELETTTIYARSDISNIKGSHKKYVT